MVKNSTLKKAMAKDKDAFRTIYESYKDFAWNLALKYTGSENMAEDAVSEVFVKLFKKINKFNFKSSFETWFYRVSINTILNYVAREKRRRTDSVENMKIPQKKTEKELDRLEREEIVDGLLKKLSSEERLIIVLREFEGLSYKEISRSLDMKLGTVKTKIYRTRNKLRKVYYGEYKN
ncbi:MAG: RNA polymerase sigma factor [Elusimicrobiota bacterium]